MRNNSTEIYKFYYFLLDTFDYFILEEKECLKNNFRMEECSVRMTNIVYERKRKRKRKENRHARNSRIQSAIVRQSEYNAKRQYSNLQQNRKNKTNKKEHHRLNSKKG
jgi:hypothetical protein